MIKKYSTLKRTADKGEYWILENTVLDASEWGHDLTIVDYLKDKEPKTEEEKKIVDGQFNSGGRQYGLKELDGIRITQDQVEVSTLDYSKIKKIYNFFKKQDKYSEIGIQVNANRKFYFPVPLSDIESGDFGGIRKYESSEKTYFGWKIVSFHDNKAYSLYETTQEIPLNIGKKETTSKGMYLGTTPQFCLDYYSGGTDFEELLLKYKYNEKDLIKGDPNSRDGEVIVKAAELVEFKKITSGVDY